MLTYRLPGTLEENDFLTPALWDAGARGLAERDGFTVAYFEAPVELPFPGGEWVEEPDEDWVARFRESLVPVTVGAVTLVPSWRVHEAPGEGIVLVIDPGMAFGTGHHETTRLAIRALQRLEWRGSERVLDYGAGSGVLAIAALKLGAGAAVGVDIDASTVPVAGANAAANAVSATFIVGSSPHAAAAAAGPGGRFDVIVANLFAELHDAMMADYRARLVPGGRLILTGILAGAGRADDGEAVEWSTSSGRESLVAAALAREGLAFVRREQEGEWVLLEARSAG